MDDSKAEALMKTAYEKFNRMENLALGKRWHAVGLTNPEKMAVLLGNMNYQTENGGLGQWYDNGYGKEEGPNGTAAHVAIAALADRYHDLDPQAADAILDMMNAVEKTLRAAEPGDAWYDDGQVELYPLLEKPGDAWCDLSQEQRLDFIDGIIAASSEADDPFDTDFSFYRLSERMVRTLGPRS